MPDLLDDIYAKPADPVERPSVTHKKDKNIFQKTWDAVSHPVDEAKAISHAASEELKKIEHGTVNAAKAAGHKVASGVKSVEHKVASGVKSVEHKVASGVKSAEKKVKKTAKKVEKEVVKDAKATWDFTKTNAPKALHAVEGGIEHIAGEAGKVTGGFVGSFVKGNLLTIIALGGALIFILVVVLKVI